MWHCLIVHTVELHKTLQWLYVSCLHNISFLANTRIQYRQKIQFNQIKSGSFCWYCVSGKTRLPLPWLHISSYPFSKSSHLMPLLPVPAGLWIDLTQCRLSKFQLSNSLLVLFFLFVFFSTAGACWCRVCLQSSTVRVEFLCSTKRYQKGKETRNSVPKLSAQTFPGVGDVH